LDAIFHQPGWVGLDDTEFARRVEAATIGDCWVVDGNYSRIRQIVWSRADTVVVLDLPRWRVMSQLLVRTVRRGWTGAELWNGNRENLRNLIRGDPGRTSCCGRGRTMPRTGSGTGPLPLTRAGRA